MVEIMDGGIHAVTVEVPQGSRLGLSLVGGAETGEPLTILSVNEGSIAAQSGLVGGVQILSVNGKIFTPQTSHQDAIVALTTETNLEIYVKTPGEHEEELTEGEEEMDDKAMGEISYGVKKTDICSTLSIYLQKRHALDNFLLVEVSASIWIAGWNQKEPALTGKFHVGDQLLSVNGQPVTTVAEAQSIMELTPGGVELLLKRMPLAAEYKLHREKVDEDWGMQIRQNRLVDVIQGSIAWTAGIQPFSAEFADQCCSWAITEINRRPVSVLCQSTDVILSKVDCANHDVSLTVQPSQFVGCLSNSLLNHKSYEDFVARA